MLRRHAHLVCLALLATAFLSGCGLITIKNGVPRFGKQDQWEPEEEEEDKWGYVGKQGRGNRQLEDENDPLKKILMSKEAQDIERNLGYK